MANDVKITMTADASAIIRENQKLVASEKEAEKQFARTAAGKEAATKKITQEAAKAGAAVEAYELAAPGGFGGTPAVRFSAARARSPRAMQLAPLAAGISASGLVVPAVGAGGAIGLGIEARGDAGLSSIDRLLARGSASVSAASIRAANIAAGQRQLDANKLQAIGAKYQPFVGPGAGMAAVATIGAGVATASAAFDKAAETSRAISGAAIDLEKAIAPLAATGNNMSILPRIRERVMASSISSGRPMDEIAAGLFQFEGNAQALPEAKRSRVFSAAMQMSDLGAAKLDDTINVLTKTLTNYGHELKTTNEAQAKLFKTMELGSVTMGELSTMLPDILPAAKLMGIPFNEVGGSIITATQTLGRNEKAFTGLRNFYLRLPEAQEFGVDTSRGMMSSLDQLAGLNPAQLKKIFDTEGVTVASALIQKRANVRGYTADVGATPDNLLARKVATRYGDSMALDTMAASSSRAVASNIDVLGALDKTRRDRANTMQMTTEGYDLENRGSMGELFDVTGLGRKVAIASAVSGPAKDNPYLALQLSTIIDKKRLAQRELGDSQAGFEADLLQLRYGDVTDTYTSSRLVPDMYGGGQRKMKNYTGEWEAKEFAGLHQKGYTGLSAQEFVEWKRVSGADARAGKQYLEDRGLPGESSAGAKGGQADAVRYLRMAADALEGNTKSASGPIPMTGVSKQPIGVLAPGGM